MKIRNMTATAVFTAVLCVVAPFTIPIGPIPLTLATLIIYLVASALDWRLATLSVVVYIAIGAVGLPVFSKMQGGIQVLVGPTGGFLAGYIACALIAGLIISRHPTNKWLYPPAMLLGTIALYALGTAWFMFSMSQTLGASLLLFVPHLIGDAFKIIIASIIGPRLRAIIQRQQA